MEDITRLTVHELVEKLNKNELSSEEIVKAYVNKKNEEVFYYLFVSDFECSTLCAATSYKSRLHR